MQGSFQGNWFARPSRILWEATTEEPSKSLRKQATFPHSPINTKSEKDLTIIVLAFNNSLMVPPNSTSFKYKSHCRYFYLAKATHKDTEKTQQRPRLLSGPESHFPMFPLSVPDNNHIQFHKETRAHQPYERRLGTPTLEGLQSKALSLTVAQTPSSVQRLQHGIFQSSSA